LDPGGCAPSATGAKGQPHFRRDRHAIIEELRDCKANPRERHFLKFLYGNQDACHLLLRNVLRDPEVYSKHPEPEVGAAMMVCDQFRPQLQAILCKYAKVAQELDLKKALHMMTCKTAVAATLSLEARPIVPKRRRACG
jgi:hypothetical protein